MSAPRTGDTVELRDYLAVLRRQAWLVAAVALLVAAIATGWSLQRPRVWESTATVLVEPITTDPFDPGRRVDQQVNMNTERQLVRSAPVAEAAAKAVGGGADPATMAGQVTVEVSEDSQVLLVTFADGTPGGARRGAAAFASAFLDFRRRQAIDAARERAERLQASIKDLGGQLAELNRAIETAPLGSDERAAAQAQRELLNGQVTAMRNRIAELTQLDVTPGMVVRDAAVPESPSSPDHRVDVAVGLFAGAFLGVVVGFARDRVDDRLRGREDLAARLDRPVLAVVPKLPRAGSRGWPARGEPVALVTVEAPGTPAAESYRTLRARLARLGAQLDVRTLMVVSAQMGEGKTTTAANLSVALAESGRDVLLISADMRRPRVHTLFGLPNRSGLANLLTGEAGGREQRGQRLAAELWSVAEHLWVVPAGPAPPDPSSLLDSDRMRELLKEQRDLYDFVVLDCPPALVVADALALASLVDGVVVVADERTTRRAHLDQLAEQLRQAGPGVLGAVLNRARIPGQSYYYEPSEARP